MTAASRMIVALRVRKNSLGAGVGIQKDLLKLAPGVRQQALIKSAKNRGLNSDGATEGANRTRKTEIGYKTTLRSPNHEASAELTLPASNIRSPAKHTQNRSLS
jgi:hypothetical protein